MHSPLPPLDDRSRDWRRIAKVALAVAGAELVALVVVAGVVLTGSDGTRTAAPGATPAVKAAKGGPLPAAKAPVTKKAAADRALGRARVSVLVLNGNGVSGAASRAASRVQRKGYRVGAVGNAPRMDYTRSLVMYRQGFEAEGKRLARDLGIRIVGPIDGLRPRQMKGAHAVVVVGS